MSEVKRYNVFDVPTHAGHSLVERVEKDGKWVLFEDYVALHLQVQTLISANEDLRVEWTGLANERDELRKQLYEQGKALAEAEKRAQETKTLAPQPIPGAEGTPA
jgi:hypothetical protein